MIRRPPRSTRTDTLFPYTTLFRSEKLGDDSGALASAREADAPDIPADQQVQPADYVRIETARLENRTYPTIAPRPETARLAYLMLALHPADCAGACAHHRSEEHTSELQSLMRLSYAVFCLKKTNTHLHSLHPLSYPTS